MEKFVISSINVPFWLISNPQKVWMFDEVTPDCKGFEAYFYSYFIFLGLLVILSGPIYVKTADLQGYFCHKRSTSLCFGQFRSSNVFFGVKLYFSSFGSSSFRCLA